MVQPSVSSSVLKGREQQTMKRVESTDPAPGRYLFLLRLMSSKANTLQSKLAEDSSPPQFPIPGCKASFELGNT